MKTLGIVKSETFDINVVFIGFESELVLEDNIKLILPPNIDPLQFANYSFPHTRYILNFSFSHLSEEKTNDLEEYILDIAINESIASYRPNVTQVEEYVTTGNISDPLSLFILYSGLVIDSNLIEDYIFQNIYEDNLENQGYTLYMMNFSQFDSSDHMQEHTYSVSGVEYDANVSVVVSYGDFDVKNYGPSMGWGGKHRFCFIDVSASPDFLGFLPFIYGNFNGYMSKYYYRYDLDSFVDTLNMTSYAGKASLAIYLSEWIQTYLTNVFQNYAVNTPLVGETFFVPFKVFNNVSKYGYTKEELSWSLSSERVRLQLEDAFPWINWIIDIEYVELEDYPDIFNNIAQNIREDESGQYVDIGDGLYALLEEQLDIHFDMTAADVVLPSYSFINDDVHFRTGTLSFGGLGGMGFQILIRTPYSMYTNGDLDKPVNGYSDVAIHEIGHSLSLPHPHSGYYGWGASYIEDTMSYFALHLAGVSCFSSFFRDIIARYYFDYYYISTNRTFEDVIYRYNQIGKLIGIDKYTEKIPQLLIDAYNSYLDMDYQVAIENARKAYNLLDEFEKIVENPSVFRKPAIFWSLTVGGGIVVLSIIPVSLYVRNIVIKKSQINRGKQCGNTLSEINS